MGIATCSGPTVLGVCVGGKRLVVTGGLSWLAIALGRLTRHGIVVVDTAHRPRLGSDAGVTWGRGKGVRGDCSVKDGGGGGGVRGVYEGSMELMMPTDWSWEVTR